VLQSDCDILNPALLLSLTVTIRALLSAPLQFFLSHTLFFFTLLTPLALLVFAI